MSHCQNGRSMCLPASWAPSFCGKQVKEDRDVISYEWLRRCAELKHGTGVLPAEYLHLSAATRAAKSDVIDRYGCPCAHSSPRLTPRPSFMPLLATVIHHNTRILPQCRHCFSYISGGTTVPMREISGNAWHRVCVRPSLKCCTAES